MELSLVNVSDYQIFICSNILDQLIWQSPDGRTVATAAGDETLKFWNAFGTPEVKKAAPKAEHPGPFPHLRRIR